jgi:parvulin-like peptidyl-prolyl isomerase
MRRVYLPYFVSFLLGGLACTEAPKPEKATDLDQIEKAEGGDAASALGAIPDGPIAVVGSVEIPAELFKEVYDLKVKKYSERGREIPATADRRYRKSIAERLIYNEVLKQEAAALGVEYDKAELEAREGQQKRGIRDWDKHLERRGETERSLREMFIAELREKAILEKAGKLAVNDEEIAADYEKIKGNWKSDKPRAKASHILIPIGPKPERAKAGEQPAEPGEEEKKKWEEEAKKKADEVYALVSAPGADFEAIAREHSTGPSAQKGGDIGIFTPDRMAEEFSEAAFKMEPGEISKPVKTKFGYHIIKVTGRWPAGELPLDALRDQIEERLEQRKLHQGRRELKDELLAKYQVTDNIKPTLGPEPQRGNARRERGERGHAPMRGGKGRDAGDARAIKSREDAGAEGRVVAPKGPVEAGAAAEAGAPAEAGAAAGAPDAKLRPGKDVPAKPEP